MADPGAPVAPRVPVTSTYHGVEVVEDYRWLEDDASPQTHAWTRAQQERTRAHLDGLPGRAALRERVEGLLRADSTTHLALSAAGGRCFVLVDRKPRQRPFLVLRDDLTDTGERVLLDPVARDPSGETTIDWATPSPDGSLVAVSLSEHGDEDGTLHVLDVATGAEVAAPVPHVNVMGGSVAWRADGRGLWYTLPGDPAGLRQQVWFRDLDAGTDVLDLDGPFAEPDIAENFLSSSADGRWVLDRVQRGDGGEWQVFVRPQVPGGRWWRVADLAERCVLAVLGDDAVWLLARQGAPRGRVLRLPLEPGATVADAEEVVPQGDLAVEDLAVTEGALWVVETDGGPQRLRRYDLGGRAGPEVRLPPVSAVSSYAARLVRVGPDRVAWRQTSFTEPAAWWVAPDDGPAERTALVDTSPADLSGYEVTRETATSRDGTRVPVTVVAPPGTPRDGTAPTVLTGYGGYGISLVPEHQPDVLLWLEQGGGYAVANVRGGSEHGEEWHHAGRLTTKQNCFDDLAACAEHLVATGVTSPERLALVGGSNGGLLVGAVLTQHPGLARAVVALVPVLDSLRSETTTNGLYNTAEFGSVEDPEQCAALLAYSPYHRVEDGTAYPAVLLTAAEHDTRVEAWHATKMAARLQAATTSGHPVLLRVDAGGHLAGSLDQTVEETTDLYAFLCAELGVELGIEPAVDAPAS